ncbi:MAG: hypothetical protein JW863_02800 [Chitinispirillaceae bacterium]|nr:hypothetical protein [Chitinispirillaceae bacterium]
MKLQSRHQIVRWIFRIVIIVFLTILYTMILPLHHHEDMHEHADCTLCRLSYIAAIIVTVSICLAATGLTERIFRKIQILPIHRRMFAISTRAPPRPSAN